MRLTEKETNIIGLETGFYRIKKDNSNSCIADNCGNQRELNSLFLGQQKLGQLEDIEQELGIDLKVLFKALEGIYIKPDNIYVGSPYLCFAENEIRKLELQFKVADTWFKVKDYGKTWALTKEELL